MFRSTFFVLLNIWCLVGTFSMENDNKTNSFANISHAQNQQQRKKIYGHNKHDDDAYFEPKVFPSLLNLTMNQNFHESFRKQKKEESISVINKNEVNESWLREETNQPANNMERKYLSKTLSLVNNFVDDGTGKFAKLNKTYSTFSNEELNDFMKNFNNMLDGVLLDRDTSSKRNLSINNTKIEDHSNDVFVNFGIENYELEMKSDFSGDDSLSIFSSEYGAVRLTEEEEYLLEMMDLSLYNQDDDNEHILTEVEMTTDIQNYSMLSGNVRKGIRILPIVNYTVATMIDEDVCVICLSTFDDCPKFQVNLIDPKFDTDETIHKVHNSQWHEECIVEWIAINLNQEKVIYCPLCQEILKDPRFKRNITSTNLTTAMQIIPNNQNINLWHRRDIIIIFTIIFALIFLLIQLHEQ